MNALTLREAISRHRSRFSLANGVRMLDAVLSEFKHSQFPTANMLSTKPSFQRDVRANIADQEGSEKGRLRSSLLFIGKNFA